MQVTKRCVTTISIPDNKIETFQALKEIIENDDLGTISSLFLEFIDNKFAELSKSCSLEYFAPKINADTGHMMKFLMAIRSDKVLWDKFGTHIQNWINHYNEIEKGRIFCL